MFSLQILKRADSAAEFRNSLMAKSKMSPQETKVKNFVEYFGTEITAVPQSDWMDFTFDVMQVVKKYVNPKPISATGPTHAVSQTATRVPVSETNTPLTLQPTPVSLPESSVSNPKTSDILTGISPLGVRPPPTPVNSNLMSPSPYRWGLSPGFMQPMTSSLSLSSILANTPSSVYGTISQASPSYASLNTPLCGISPAPGTSCASQASNTVRVPTTTTGNGEDNSQDPRLSDVIDDLPFTNL